MAIVVDYTPGDAVQQLATQAGINRVAQQQAEFQQKQQLMELDNQMKQANMQFMQQAEQAARAEEAGYRMQLLTAKRDIDIQMEVQMYQRDREKLNLSLDMIRDADYLTDAEKEDLTLQTTSRYGTGGNLPAFVNKADPLQRKLMESTIKSNFANELMGQVANNALTAEQAQFQYAAAGFGKLEFTTPEMDASHQMAQLNKELDDANAAFNRLFVMDGKEILNKITLAVVKKGTPEYATASTLQKVINNRTKSLADFEQGSIVAQELEAEWESETSIPAIQKLIQLNGYEAARKLWMTRRTKGEEPLKHGPYSGPGVMARSWGGWSKE